MMPHPTLAFPRLFGLVCSTIVATAAVSVSSPTFARGCGHRPPQASVCHPVAGLHRGGPARTVSGRIRTPSDRFNFCFQGRRGDVLTDRFHGPAVRLVLTAPNGDGDGPGLPETVRLHQTGRYVFTVSPNTMADGIFGRFRLTLRLR